MFGTATITLALAHILVPYVSVAIILHDELEMWSNAKRDGRPVDHRWCLCSKPQSLADAHY